MRSHGKEPRTGRRGEEIGGLLEIISVREERGGRKGEGKTQFMRRPKTLGPKR